MHVARMNPESEIENKTGLAAMLQLLALPTHDIETGTTP